MPVPFITGNRTLTFPPAEFHSQTAVEAAQRLNKKLAAMGKTAADIEKVVNRTHEACIRIIDKQFKPMENFADRDHCLQVSSHSNAPAHFSVSDKVV